MTRKRFLISILLAALPLVLWLEDNAARIKLRKPFKLKAQEQVQSAFLAFTLPKLLLSLFFTCQISNGFNKFSSS